MCFPPVRFEFQSAHSTCEQRPWPEDLVATLIVGRPRDFDASCFLRSRRLRMEEPSLAEPSPSDSPPAVEERGRAALFGTLPDEFPEVSAQYAPLVTRVVSQHPGPTNGQQSSTSSFGPTAASTPLSAALGNPKIPATTHVAPTACQRAPSWT